MCHDSFRPTRDELVDFCDCCGEELDMGHCVTLACPIYQYEVHGLHSPIRDTRDLGFQGEDEKVAS